MEKKGLKKRVPAGTIVDNNGYWWWLVKLPGDEKRRKYPLKMPGSPRAMRTAEKPRSLAESAAWLLWEDRVRSIEGGNTEGATVDDICDAWTRHCEEYYRDADGSPTKTAQDSVTDVRLMRQMYGDRPIAELSHPDMLRIRDALVEAGLSLKTVNARLATVRRMIAWALDEALIPAAVKAELTQVRPVKRGRTKARSPEPVMPADDAAVEAVAATLAPNTADMVRVHRLTGMRPGELCAMRWADIDRGAEPWIYRPSRHKTAWRGNVRVILIGPRARVILERLRAAGGSEREYPFSPAVAVAERLASARAARKTRVQPSQVSRRVPDARRRPGDRWTAESYARAIQRACDAAGVARWHPHQLRHSFATEVRRRFGIDATRAVLGHSLGVRITDRYSRMAIEDEIVRVARDAVETLG